METPDDFETRAKRLVEALNQNVEKRAGKGRPLYQQFEYMLGQKHARIYTIIGGGKSAIAFLGRDGFIRRADSWRKTGRILGEHDSRTAFEYIAGPMVTR
jgi:hypothetical protein